MPTYLDAVTDVQQDFLNRTDFSTQVKKAVNATIRHYNRERFGWNSTATALVAVAGAQTIALPADFVLLDRLEYVWNSTALEIVEQDFGTIRKINCDLSQGTPSFYALY